MMKNCVRCGALLPDDATYCERCGAEQKASEKEQLSEGQIPSRYRAIVGSETVTGAHGHSAHVDPPAHSDVIPEESGVEGNPQDVEVQHLETDSATSLAGMSTVRLKKGSKGTASEAFGTSSKVSEPTATPNSLNGADIPNSDTASEQNRAEREAAERRQLEERRAAEQKAKHDEMLRKQKQEAYEQRRRKWLAMGKRVLLVLALLLLLVLLILGINALLKWLGRPTDVETIEVNGVKFHMVRIDSGSFEMGAQNLDPKGTNFDADAYDDESPVHEVMLSTYYIGETEVTQALWKAVMGEGSNPSYAVGDSLPVEMVTWNDCQKFVARLSQLTGRHFSLPTEAQWEYAARGGALASPTRFAGSNNIDSVAWYADNSDGKTHPVATKAPNALGIYDMTGNVHEWCYDWFGNYPNMSQTDPKGEEFGSTKILRGGSAFREERVARVSVRNGSNPIDEGKGSGLRIVMRP